ncbi:MAG: sugar phosphate isomerase/epimerase, partial [Imperialibacter sp.]
MQRRKFILSSAMALAAASSSTFPVFSATKQQRKFKLALNPGIIGVKANFAQTLDYAIQYGYEA